METNRIDYIIIQQYLEGSLDREAMHELEKRALDDPFLADALEGYSYINKPASKQLSLLQTQLEERIAQQQENKNIFNFSWQRLSVAAAASLLFITASILFWIKGQKAEEQIALNPKQVEVSLTPADSIVANDATSKKESIATISAPATKGKVKPKENLQIASSESATTSASNSREALNVPQELNEVSVMAYGDQKKQAGLEIASSPKSEKAEIRIRGMASASSKTGVLGRVVSGDGQPISGATVKLKNSNKSYTTNSIGVFHFSDSVAGELIVSQIGFNSKEVSAKAGEYLTITLEKNSQSLSGTIAGVTSSDLNQNPQPVIGWDKYKEYLQNNVKSDANLPTGRVVVTFNVNSDNQLSDFKIKKGLNDLRNEEAIRLIKEGPSWKAGKQKDARVVVRFK